MLAQEVGLADSVCALCVLGELGYGGNGITALLLLPVVLALVV